MTCAEKVFHGQVSAPIRGIDYEAFRAAVRSTLMVDAQNIHNYLEEITQQRVVFAADFPAALSPWRNCLIYFDATAINRSMAIACYAGTWQELTTTELPTAIENFQFPDGDYSYGLFGIVWLSQPGDPAFIVGDVLLAYNPDGDLIQWKGLLLDDIEQQAPELSGLLSNATVAVTATCSFANCKNVTLYKVPASRQVRRRAERRGDPIFEHHVLSILPIQGVLESKGRLHEHGDLKRSLHICRGHFASYGESFGKGRLFGRYEGRFWMPQCVRGKVENGIVSKEYKVKTEQ